MDFFEELNALIDRAVTSGVGMDEILGELEMKAQAIREEMAE